METNIAKIQKYKSWGFNLTPANYKPDDKSKDKKLVAVKNSNGQYKKINTIALVAIFFIIFLTFKFMSLLVCYVRIENTDTCWKLTV